MPQSRAIFAVMLVGIAVAGGLGSRAEKESAARSDDAQDADHARRHAEMVRTQLAARDITDPRVLEAIGRVPRHRFVRPGDEPFAYEDRARSINQGQTISQPYIVALMTQLAQAKPGDRVLDIGTGSGYQAAVLAEIGADVWSIEIIPELAAEAKARLAALNYKNIEVRAGDGYRGWPEHAPFHAIVLAAATPQAPQPLLDQLAAGGRLVLPVGDSSVQELLVLTKQADGSTRRETVAPVISCR